MVWLVRIRLTLCAILAGKAMVGTVYWIISAI